MVSKTVVDLLRGNVCPQKNDHGRKGEWKVRPCRPPQGGRTTGVGLPCVRRGAAVD